MKIWFNKQFSVEDIKALGSDYMADFIGIEWVEVGDDFITAKMPVDKRTRQPYGYLHGGASCVLAETIGSVASAMVVDHSRFLCLGLEINANHIRSVKEGFVYGTVRPLHLGRSTHVWDIRIVNENQQLVCISRHTVKVIKRTD